MQERTGLYAQLIATKTLVRREVYRFMRIWSQTLIPPAITMTLYFLIFGKLIGSQLRDIEGYDYIQYIAPGLVMMSIMTNAYANTASSFFLTKFNKSIEEMLVSPMANFVTLIGFVLGGALRGLMVGAIIVIIALLFTDVPLHHPVIMLSMGLLAALTFSLGGLINGIYAKRFDDISFIPTFILTPLTYLGGVFFSLKQLPEPWRNLSMFNPIFDMVDTFRFGWLNISEMSVTLGFSLVGLLFVILFVWAWKLLLNGTGVKM